MNKIMFAMTALVGLAVTNGARAQQGPVRQPDQPNGRARMRMQLHGVSIIINGKPMSAGAARSARMTLDGNNFSLALGGSTITTGTFDFDRDDTPKKVDMVCASGIGQGFSIKGIYEVKGDTMTICYAPPGKDRPTEFRSTPGSGYRLYVWQIVGNNTRPSLTNNRRTGK
jgi:uncharacterized protein (TIGR03067 family)